MFPDYSKTLTTITSKGASYTATENCFVIGTITNTTNNYGANVLVDGVTVCIARATSGTVDIRVFIPVKKGQTVTTRATYGEYNLAIYAMQS